jgi:hypothetical protein
MSDDLTHQTDAGPDIGANDLDAELPPAFESVFTRTGIDVGEALLI